MITGGMVTPDYNAIIDRLMAPIKAKLDAQLKALEAQTAFQRSLGTDNARLQQESIKAIHEQAQKSINDTNTAHGLLDSGDTHYRHNQESANFSRQSQLQANQLLAYLTNLENQLRQQVIDQQNALETALLNAQDYAATNYSPTKQPLSSLFNPAASSVIPPAGRY
jgi:hypothetical protein